MVKNRRAIEAAAIKRFDRLAGFVSSTSREHMCLHWAFATALALGDFGYDACVNAGSAEFLAVPDEFDNGIDPTHFSYHWQNESREEIERKYLSAMILPEMHVWAAVPSERLIVDMTTQFLPRLSARAGVPWRAPEPPVCLWASTLGDLPPKWSYSASQAASELAYALIERLTKVE